MSRYLYKKVLPFHILRNHPSLRTLTSSSTASTAATASSSPPPHPSPFTVHFLTESCGLTPEKALSAAQTLRLDEEARRRPESVLEFFRSHGFSKTHIAEIVARRPRLLRYRTEATLLPKFQFLTRMGLSPPDIRKLILSNPNILTRSLDKQIGPCFDFFKCFVGTNENVLAVLRRYKWFLTFDLRARAMRNVALLVDLGVPKPSISKLVLVHPRAVMRDPGRFAEIVESVKRLGIRPEQCLFAHAVRAMNGLSKSSFAAKVELLKSLGWSEEEVFAAFRRAPLCMLVSKEKMRSVNSFARRVGLGPSDLSVHPNLLMYGLEKRTLPRYAVLQVLKSKGLVGKKNGGAKKLIAVSNHSEKVFLDRYVRSHMDRVPELMDVYLGKIKFEEIDSDFGEGNRVVLKL